MLSEKDKRLFSLEIISDNYIKMLLVNVSDYTYYKVKIPDDELAFATSDKIVDYWNWFCSSDLIHNDDRQDCIEYGARVQFGTHLLYRRKLNNKWCWVLMELTKAKRYTDGNDYCVCYVRDIDSIYKPEYNEIVEKLGTVDEQTKLLNKYAFVRDRERYKNEKVGIMYADLNGLKFTNDTYGHKAGDDLIQKFAALLSVNFSKAKCYHLSGDEFAVIASGEALNCFLDKAIAFHKSMWLMLDFPIASTGFSISDVGEFDQAFEKAEKEMYADKHIFYKQFPEFKRI